MASVDFGMRYAYAPMALIGLSVLGLAATAGGMTRLVAGALVAWLIVVGGMEYFWVPREMANGPDWRAEVAAWRANPAHLLQTWPGGGWVFALDPAKQPR